jgi:hypothetical protein
MPAVKLMMRLIENGSGFASGIPETVVPLQANVSVRVSTACAVVDRAAGKNHCCWVHGIWSNWEGAA